MNNLPVNEGEQMRYWLVKSGFTKRQVWEGMGLKSYSNLDRYLSQAKIKSEVISTFCGVIGISLDVFYKTVIEKTKEKPHQKNSEKHSGKSMQQAFARSGIKITAAIKKLGVSRSTLYNWFKQPVLDNYILLQVSDALKIPVSEIKGIGTGQQGFERDIYLILASIDKKLDELLEKSNP